MYLLLGDADLNCRFATTVDGRDPYYSHGFIHPKWLFGISEPLTVILGRETTQNI